MAENSDQNQSESNNDQDGRESTESNSHLTLANLSRFGAVALFVVLGTFAVIYSMRSTPKHDDAAAHDHDHEEQQVADGTKLADGANGVANKTAEAKTEDKANADSDKAKTQPKFELAKVAKIPALGLSAASSMVTFPGSSPKVPPKDAVAKPHPNSIVHSLGSSQAKPAKQAAATKPSTLPPAQKQPAADRKSVAASTNKLRPNAFPIPSVGIPTPDKSTAKAKPIAKPPEFNPDAFAPPSQKDFSKQTSQNNPPSARTQRLTATPPPQKTDISPFDTPPSKTSASPAKPPERLAQAPGGRPLAGSNGFGIGAPKVDTTGNSFAAKTGQSARAALDDLMATGQQVKTQAASNLDKTKQSFANAASEFPPIGTQRQTAPPARPPAGQGFDPPSFGGMNDLTSRPPGTRQIESAPIATKSSGPSSITNAPPPASNLIDNSPFARQPATRQTPPRSEDNSIVRSKADIPEVPANSFGSPPPQTDNGSLNTNARVPARNASTSRTLSSPPPAAAPIGLPSNISSAATLDVPGDRDLDGIQAPALTLQKIPPREVQVNQVAEFQVVIKNVGRTAVNEVNVFDRVPEGTNFEGATPTPNTSTNGQLRWNLGTIEPGTEKRIAVRLKPTRPGIIGSVAQFSFSTPTSMRTRVTEPKLEISHQTKPKVLIGDDVIFDVAVTNKGDGPARNVLIQEDIPTQLSFRDNYEEIEYEVGTLQPGQTKKVRLALKAKQAGRLTNTMFATAAGGLKSEHALNMEVVAPTLKVKSEGPVRRFLGRNMKHQLSLSNQGTAPATNVELIAKLPSGLRFVRCNNQGTYDPATHSVFWSLAQLESKVDAGVELETTPVNVGNHPIKVETFADLNLRDQTVQALSIEHRIDVFFDIDDVVDPIEIGSETQHRVHVVNQGTKTVTNVQLQIDYPNGLKPTKVNGPLTHNIQKQVVRFNPIANLKPGEKISFTVNSVGQASGDHRVSLKLSSDDRKQPISKEESTHVYSDR